MAQVNITVDSELLKGLFTAEGKEDAFASLVSMILNQVLSAQASEQAGAELYERNDTAGHIATGIGDERCTQG